MDMCTPAGMTNSTSASSLTRLGQEEWCRSQQGSNILFSWRKMGSVRPQARIRKINVTCLWQASRVSRGRYSRFLRVVSTLYNCWETGGWLGVERMTMGRLRLIIRILMSVIRGLLRGLTRIYIRVGSRSINWKMPIGIMLVGRLLISLLGIIILLLFTMMV